MDGSCVQVLFVENLDYGTQVHVSEGFVAEKEFLEHESVDAIRRWHRETIRTYEALKVHLISKVKRPRWLVVVLVS